VTIRCLLDGLLLNAIVGGREGPVTAYDGDEAFGMEAIEAAYYEIVEADADELLGLEQVHFRLLHRADDFMLVKA
jgi:hypothetical protein